MIWGLLIEYFLSLLPEVFPLFSNSILFLFDFDFFSTYFCVFGTCFKNTFRHNAPKWLNILCPIGGMRYSWKVVHGLFKTWGLEFTSLASKRTNEESVILPSSIGSNVIRWILSTTVFECVCGRSWGDDHTAAFSNESSLSGFCLGLVIVARADPTHLGGCSLSLLEYSA